MAMKQPSVGANKWATNLAGSSEAIKAGVNSVTESPTAKAAQNLDKAAANYQEAVSSGRMAAKLNAVSTQDWKTSMIDKGLPRIQQGAQQGKANYLKFANSFYPVAAEASQLAKSMPNNNVEEGLNRVRAVVTKFKQWAGKPTT